MRIDCDLEHNQGEDCVELIDWQSENTCKLSFHWPVKIEGDMSTCLHYKEWEKRLPEKYVHGEYKVQLT